MWQVFTRILPTGHPGACASPSGRVGSRQTHDTPVGAHAFPSCWRQHAFDPGTDFSQSRTSPCNRNAGNDLPNQSMGYPKSGIWVNSVVAATGTAQKGCITPWGKSYTKRVKASSFRQFLQSVQINDLHGTVVELQQTLSLHGNQRLIAALAGYGR